MSANLRDIKVIAHRGNSLQAPENTKAAFNQAIKLHPDFIECDVQISKDGIPVVMHDGCFTRITKSMRIHKVDALDYEEIKNIDAGSWFSEEFSKERILTLMDFLQLNKGNMGMMLDVKDETVKEDYLASHIAEVIKEYCHKHPHHGPLLVGSLNPNILYCFEGFLPEQQLIPIVRIEENLKRFRGIPAKYYALHHSIAKKELIEELHGQGKEVWSWTVDDTLVAKRLISDGIDGLITNAPKKILSLENTT